MIFLKETPLTTFYLSNPVLFRSSWPTYENAVIEAFGISIDKNYLYAIGYSLTLIIRWPQKVEGRPLVMLNDSQFTRHWR